MCGLMKVKPPPAAETGAGNATAPEGSGANPPAEEGARRKREVEGSGSAEGETSISLTNESECDESKRYTILH